MNLHRFGLGLVIAMFSTSLASAILIDTKTGQVGGYLLSDDGTKLRISIPTPDGEDKIGEYLLADIKVLHRLDVKRLESLSPDDPQGYCNYAEELARQKADPEARYTAKRLYLIAAYLRPKEFGSRSLLGMSTLANTPIEVRKYRAMAFVLDPKADTDLLKAETAKPDAAPFPARALEDFIKALQLYRSGQIRLASDMARHEGVDKVFSRAPGKIDLKTFLQWCTDANCTTCRADGTVACPNCNGRGIVLNAFMQAERCPTCKGKKRAPCPDCGGTHVRDPLPEAALRVVLRCELWAIERQGSGENAGRNKGPDTNSWSAILQSRRLSPVVPLSLETITSFDPRKCRYRNRKWVED